MRIPDKHYFKIGEVAELAGVEPYVIRYWETEFKSLRPQKSRSNQRLFRRKDVERILEIRRLLYEEGYKIEGARRLMEAGQTADVDDSQPDAKVDAKPEGGDTKAGGKAKGARGKVAVAPNVAALRALLDDAKETLATIEKILDDDEAL